MRRSAYSLFSQKRQPRLSLVVLLEKVRGSGAIHLRVLRYGSGPSSILAQTKNKKIALIPCLQAVCQIITRVFE
jgi:hypothetical protein